MDVQEPLGVPVAHDDADLQGQQPAVALRARPRRRPHPLRRGPGPARTGRKLTSQSAPPPSAGDHVLVGVAGERAAVVPRHGEAGGQPQGTPAARAFPDPPVVTRFDLPGEPAPEGPGDQADHRADGHAADDVAGVVDPDVEPADSDDCGQARVDRGEAGIGARTAGRRHTAVLAWPLGKLVVRGTRILSGRGSWDTGRSRWNRRLHDPLTTTDSTPRVAVKRAPTAMSRS